MLQDKIREHEEKIASFRSALAALESGESATVVPYAGKKRGPKPGKRGRKPGKAKEAASEAAAPARRGRKRGPKKGSKQNRGGETLEAWLIKDLTASGPKTNRQLMESYNKATGKGLNMNGFAARMAIIKKKNNIKSYHHSNGISYNGLAAWFEKGKMKKEYLAKAK